MSAPRSINIKRRSSESNNFNIVGSYSSRRSQQIHRLSHSPLQEEFVPPQKDSYITVDTPSSQSNWLSSRPPEYDRPIHPNYGSLAREERMPHRLGLASDDILTTEDPNIVRRHLNKKGPKDDEFSSLYLQGGDVHRQVYRWQEEIDQNQVIRRGRSRSFSALNPNSSDASRNIQDLKQAGGMRRDFLRNRPSSISLGSPSNFSVKPNFLNRNFLEFLSVYGHFAGEELSEEDEEDEEDFAMPRRVTPSMIQYSDLYEQEPLLDGQQARHKAMPKGSASNGKAVLLLLKSFVGTGVLFLPKAFLLGGLVFSSVCLLVVGLLSHICFLLLIETRSKIPGSFGDIGGVLYGPKMRLAILTSIVVSQIGFASAYISFVASTLQACVRAVIASHKEYHVAIFIFLQFLVFVPLSLIRKISKLSATALIADAFILLGILYLYFWDVFTLATKGVADVVLFNKTDFSLFIGVAIFTYEGICLILPIQEQMASPKNLPKLLTGVMLAISLLFISIGFLSYAAFGSKVQTVVILNMPQSSFTVVVQFLYAVAILLSTPLQLFPAIAIIEQGIFTRSGKRNRKVKWRKNTLRVFIVIFAILVSWAGSSRLDQFVSMVGSVCCIPLIYMYPPMLHYKACATTWKLRTLDVAMWIIGFVSMIFTAYMTLL
ncbi:vacuolar amino acid efflux transporter Avt3 [Schizosaccharomyces cryophilus OY26]|uniref:Vacuolar amino acid efflux transporter Avt3 n=1 Tax=Schizosaccharomyces cryophilus (strain OY26 / ATCC MYA-4695 / CBS 11777 / NBRC 106824 / NRRL Y48691) TaxID=653667 RepID=S9W2Q6_SCHCR|nr:vacuolar amino acid efflux transporter Avt3 [Schizosaccharomyces cryophilus OY26]EPY52819.1 vacuolar amino acid efflux transporter Avt3 [Schizosaccharomyces cryophilus OY26]